MLMVGLALCSCDPGALALPAQGSTDVPTDVVVVAQVPASESELPDLRLHDEDGTIVEAGLVELSKERWRTWFEVRPAQPVAPNTMYTLGHYDSSGTHLRDFTSFVTGDGPAEVIPAMPALEAVEVGHQPFFSNCTNSCYDVRYRDYVDVQFSRSGDAAYHEVAATGSDGQLLLAHVHGSWWTGFDNSTCSPIHPALQPGDEWCVSVTAVSITGHRSAPAGPLCTEVRSCAPIDPCQFPTDYVCVDAPPSEPDAGGTEPAADAHRGGCSAGGNGRSTLAALTLALVALATRRKIRWT